MAEKEEQLDEYDSGEETVETTAGDKTQKEDQK
jgi:hypothetical protein